MYNVHTYIRKYTQNNSNCNELILYIVVVDIAVVAAVAGALSYHRKRKIINKIPFNDVAWQNRNRKQEKYFISNRNLMSGHEIGILGIWIQAA